MVNGEVSEVGTYTELMERNGAFAEFVRTHLQEESSSDDESTEGSTRPASFDRQVSTIDHLNTKEDTENEERCKDSKFIEDESINLDGVSQVSKEYCLLTFLQTGFSFFLFLM